MKQNGIVYFIGAGPGDPELITVKGLAILKQADVVLTDQLAHPSLLSVCKPDTTIIHVGKSKGKHSKTQAEINQQLLDFAKKEAIVVRLKGGDPFIFGRLGEEMEWLTSHGITYSVIPGVSSAIAGPGYAGIPLTHRNLSRSVTFITGTTLQGTPIKDIPKTDTLVCLMGYHHLESIVTTLLKTNHLSPSTPIALLSQTATPNQQDLYSTLGNIVEDAKTTPLPTPILLVIGEVVHCAKTCEWFKKTALSQRVILCRNTGDCNEWIQPLTTHGYDVVHAPVITTEYNPNHQLTPEIIKQSDIILFTSKNAVYFFMQALLSMSLDSRALHNKSIVSLTKPIGETLKTLGLLPNYIATNPYQETILTCIPENKLKNKTILYPTSTLAMKTLNDIAQKKGAHVYHHDLYTTRLRSCDYLTIRSDDILVFFSPSAVESVFTQTSWPHPKTAIAIGKTTYKKLKSTTQSPIKLLDSPTPQALIKLLNS